MNISWQNVFPVACELAASSTKVAKQLQLRTFQGDAYFNPTSESVWFTDETSETHKASEQLEIKTKLFGHSHEDTEGPWLRVKFAAPLDLLGHASGYRPNFWTKALGGPNTLTASLGSGILGAGLGYGSGWLAEQFLPEDKFEKGKLRNTLGLLGGAAGVGPAIWAGQRGWFKPEPQDTPNTQELQKLSTLKEALDFIDDVYNYDTNPNLYEKQAYDELGFDPIIPVDDLNQKIWYDGQTPVNIRAAATGLIGGASTLRQQSPLVSPADIAQIAVGMGSGYISGLMVGKTLGALAGLRPEAQKSLQQAGVWAGLMKNIIPIAFGN